jgi:hypothetical protein
VRAVWQATRDLADVLRESGVAARFGGNLRGESQRADSQLPQRLRELFAGYGHLEAQPFLLSLRLGNIPGSEALLEDPAGEQFRSDGIAITAAAIGIIEWLRSRLPRYPIRFKLPYTDPLSSRVVDQGFPDAHWPWLLEARRAGFQALPTVAPQVARDLEIDDAPLRDALGDLRSALEASAPWARYVAAEAALSAADEAVLGELVAGYRAQTRAEVIDAIEPARVMRRMQHRHAALCISEEAARAHGGAVAEYYAAFRGLDKALGDMTALLAQLLFYEPPRAIAVQRAAWRRDAEDKRLELTIATEGVSLRLNEVVELRVELASLSGLVVVEGFNLSFQRRGDAFVEDVHVTGAVLPDSA